VTAGNAQASVTWVNPITAGGSPITTYKVVPYLGTTAVASTNVSGTASTATVKNVVNGSTYTFKMFAVNAIGTGMPSLLVGPSTIGTPTPPLNVGAQPRATAAFVFWHAPSNTNGSAITSYRVTPYLGYSALPAQTFPATATGGTVTGLTPGKSYGFTVAALNARGASNATKPVFATIGAPVSPTNITAKAAFQSVTVSWTGSALDNGSAITGYIVVPYFHSTALTAQTVPATARSVIVSGLMSAQPYTFGVSAQNAVGTSPAATSPIATPT
jgi:hypothetical protein